MKYILNTKKSSFQKDFIKVLNSKRQQSEINKSIVFKIINNVKKNGDKALIQYSKKFDNILLNKKNIKISNKEINSVVKKLDSKIKKAINLAFKRIKNFHKKQINNSFKFKDNLGNELGYKYTPN